MTYPSEKMDRLNALLSQAGKLVDELQREGFEVCMSLWDRDRPGSAVNGRLQANCCYAEAREIKL